MADSESVVQAVPSQNDTIVEHSAPVEQAPMRGPIIQKSVIQQQVTRRTEETFHHETHVEMHGKTIVNMSSGTLPMQAVLPALQPQFVPEQPVMNIAPKPEQPVMNIAPKPEPSFTPAQNTCHQPEQPVLILAEQPQCPAQPIIPPTQTAPITSNDTSQIPTSGSQHLDITLTKEDGQHWGFRLGGGKEFHAPLSVVRVQLSSMAEKQGLKVGDIVEEINGIATSDLTHYDALDLINKSGNTCLFSCRRDFVQKGKVPRPLQAMAQLQDFTTMLPNTINSRPHVAGPVAAKAVMRDVILEQKELNTQITEATFTEEVIAETMTSHAEIVAGNALGVNFHKFEPQYEHLALSSVYQMLLEEETKRGRPMSLPRRRKPEIVQRKHPLKEPTPPPKEPTPPPKEPTPPPPEKEPTPPPKEATPPPPTPPPSEEALQSEAELSESTEINLSSDEPNLIPGPEPEYLEAEEPSIESNLNGELEADMVVKEDDPSKPAVFYQKHHELTKTQQEMLEREIQHKMHLEECRKRINSAQRTIYTPTPPQEIIVEDLVTGIERKLPKAGARYKPSLPLTAACSLHQAFATQPQAFEPFQVRATPDFKPKPGFVKPCAKPAAPVTTVIPFKIWHPPNQLINGQPYKYQPTKHQPSKPLPDQEFLPPAKPKVELPPAKPVEPKPQLFDPINKPVAHPVQHIERVDIPKQIPAEHEQLTEDDIAEMMSANAEVIVGHTLGVNFQKYMPGFDHLQHSAVYRMVHGLDD